jgi:Zn-dependent protease with chaperone function
LRDPKEQTALVWLYIASIPAWLVLLFWGLASFGLVFIIIGLVLLARLIGELWFRAYLRTNAVRVSPTQLPELYQVLQSCCYRLNLPPPEVYVMQQNLWNAYAMKILGGRMVVLLSGAVDSILLTGNLQQLAWLVGHELGHHRAGHLDLSRRLALVGGWCIWLQLWYSRRAELTCDRMGLYCAGGLSASQLALMNATVGAQLAGKVNIAEAIRQWRQHRGEFFVKYRTLYSTHPHHLARLDHLQTAAAELGVRP